MQPTHSRAHERPLDPAKLPRLWVALASLSLLASGALALLITFSKMPGFKQLVADVDFVRWCLVEHVNLATLVWFTAVPVGLLHLAFTRGRENGVVGKVSLAGWVTAVAGIFLMLSALPAKGVEPVLANYIPVVQHPRYLAGLLAYLVGVALNYLAVWPFKKKPTPAAHEILGLAESSFGIKVGAAFFLFALVALALSFYQMSGITHESLKLHYELTMWGGGHLLQHMSSVFLVVTWVLMLSGRIGKPVLSEKSLTVVFVWMALPLAIVPFLFAFPADNGHYRDGFTKMMQWGIFPPVLFAWYLFARKSPKGTMKLGTDYVSASVIMSSVLIGVGFIFGSLIRAADLRVPGHYHATIGAVTVAFMAICYRMLAPAEEKVPSKWIKRTAWVYGIGQLLFSSGMFIAGTYGIMRKTYGDEHSFSHIGQYFGMGAMAVGGLAAFIGGGLFAASIIPHLRRAKPRKEERLAQSKSELLEA